jgi:hypothetical protein
MTGVQGVGIWDALHCCWTKYRSTNDFVLGALNKLKFFKSHSKINLNFSFIVMHIWVRI